MGIFKAFSVHENETCSKIVGNISSYFICLQIRLSVERVLYHAVEYDKN